MIRGSGIVVVLLALSPPAASRATAALEARAHAFGDRIGSALSRLDVQPTSPDAGREAPFDVSVTDLAAEGAPTNRNAGEGAAHRAKHGRPSSKPGGAILIDAATVLRLAESGTVPEGRPVAAGFGHPAGIELTRVAALGVGLESGDVLTEVSGRAVRTEGEVVGMVIFLRARHARKISGEFWRNGSKWSVSVEMPYVAPAQKVASGADRIR